MKRLYSEPVGLFQTVEFSNGMNLIYGKKEVGQPKNSLNSIGKSTFLDLIDFCLLCSTNKSSNPRLDSAKNIVSDFSVVLEFEIGNSPFKISRSFDTPRVIEFEEDGDKHTYDENDLKIKLCNLIFARSDYPGVFSSKWFRKLVPFYLKVQKFKKDRFTDPVKYIKEPSEVELNIYHFYLLGLNNSISCKNYEYRIDEKRLSPTIKEIKKFVEEKYSLKDLKETQNEINKLRIEIKRLEEAIEKFELGEQYQNAEEEANKLTERIKNFLYQNHVDKEKVQSYKESFNQKEEISIRRISRLFKELDEDFGKKVNETLKDAIAFRKDLSESRKEFLETEIETLNKLIEERNIKIQELEKARAKLFYFLSAKEAITDLTEAFSNLNDKRNNLVELESNTKILTDLESELSQIQTEISKLRTKSINFLNEISNEIAEFYEIFSNIFDTVYLDEEGNSKFSITQNPKKDSILEISVHMADMYGKGKNQGRTLIYDLSVLFNSLDETNFPKFIVHDGIFDGLDKSHFISTYELIQEKVNKGAKVQYITTINEEGTLSEKFGNTDVLTPGRIEEEAIIVLSPNNKLLGSNF
ncbi:MAG: DUF2326 domain-containing protein [Candidatus Kapaibacterium sp.]